MKCPVCDVTLSISSREGVEIDFCPQCRGVWLDRGELDKIIDRVNAASGRPEAAPTPPAEARSDERSRSRPAPERHPERDRQGYDRDRDRYDPDRDRDRYRDDRPDYDRRYDKRRKRRSFLEDIFDFD